MARYTHVAFRQLMAELGGTNLLYTEMLNARILCNTNPAHDIFCQKGNFDFPTAAQIVGGEPDTIATAIKRLDTMEFDAIDLNMSCPNGAIVRYGWGAALQKNTEKALTIVSHARNATTLPLFIKLRSWPDHNMEPLISFCLKLQKIGVDGITLHPREMKDGFKRPAGWQDIKILKDALTISVVGNGDVQNIESALKLLESTGCDGIMIGRAALVRPWLFWEITNQRKWQGSPMDVLERMATLMDFHFTDKKYALKIFKAFLSWFLRNWLFHRYLYGKIVNQQSISEITSYLSQHLPNEPILKNIPIVAKL